MIHGWWGHGWGMGLGWIFGLVVLGVIVWAVTRALRRHNGADSAGNQTALDILKKRYASGEISRKEFEQQKRDIM